MIYFLILMVLYGLLAYVLMGDNERMDMYWSNLFRDISALDPSRGGNIETLIKEGRYAYFRGYYVPGDFKGVCRKNNYILKHRTENMRVQNTSLHYISTHVVLQFQDGHYYNVAVDVYACAYNKCKNDCQYCEKLQAIMKANGKNNNGFGKKT